ncbi:Thioredoxin-like 4A [Clydaea vesicula]|uniref:Thioredoxin-like 4A n=1 Tax=Clydaea vesicula TaxID=447962 RepID=A0AAD5XWQ7_9FUNG|nr:Thioredoxin-like 4A [Clydaea vesicula]
MYELYDPCTVMFFYRNKHIMIDLGTGNNNKINWALEDKGEMIDIVETVFRGARKGVVGEVDVNACTKEEIENLTTGEKGTATELVDVLAELQLDWESIKVSFEVEQVKLTFFKEGLVYTISNDYVIINKLSKFKRGDVVTCISPINPFRTIVKRLIAVAGDEIFIDPTNNLSEKIIIPKGHVWLQGDNYESSRDSRFFGPVSINLLQGKVVYKFSFPFFFNLIKIKNSFEDNVDPSKVVSYNYE